MSLHDSMERHPRMMRRLFWGIAGVCGALPLAFLALLLRVVVWAWGGA